MSIDVNTKGVTNIISNGFLKYLYIQKPNPKKIDKKIGNNIPKNAYGLVVS